MSIVRRRTLELACADILDRMHTVQAPAHRQMLQRALADIDRQLKELA